MNSRRWPRTRAVREVAELGFVALEGDDPGLACEYFTLVVELLAARRAQPDCHLGG
jgi:hypothetical protein